MLARRCTRRLLIVVDDDEPAVELLAHLLRRRELGRIPDERRTAVGLARVLGDDAWDVSLTRAGPEALRRAGSSPVPDALLASISVPQSAGLAVLRRARLRRPALPIVVITSLPQPPNLEGLEPLPSVFHTPVDFAELALELRRVARAHSGSFLKVTPPLLGRYRTQPGRG
jgi:CheY-like chemotaxis protein